MATATTTTFEFAGKVVLITGAASGLGAAAAVEFARQGATLSLIDLEDLDETVQAVKNVAPRAKSTEITVLKTIGDLTVDSIREDYVLRTVAELGRIDVLVNNAATLASDNILNTSLETLDKVMDINFRALFHLSALCAPHLVKTKGNIVNVSSEYTDTLNAGYLSYTVSKAAVNQLSRSIAADLAPHGVRVNNILPGALVTNLNKAYVKDYPTVNWGQPEEAAHLIAFLASSKASFVTGSSVHCDGGITLSH